MNPNRNAVGWFEIYVRDMSRARRFYEAVFECKLDKLDSPVVEMYAFPMKPDAPGSPGALVKMDGVGPGAGTIVYFSCTDCAQEEARAVQAGGKVFKSKFSIGPHGFIALVHDSESNLIGLHSRQ